MADHARSSPILLVNSRCSDNLSTFYCGFIVISFAFLRFVTDGTDEEHTECNAAAQDNRGG